MKKFAAKWNVVSEISKVLMNDNFAEFEEAVRLRVLLLTR